MDFLRHPHIGISYTSNRSNSSEASCSTNNSGTSGTSSLSISSKNRTDSNHRTHDNCGSHCLGAIPRNPQYNKCMKTTQPKMPSNSAQPELMPSSHHHYHDQQTEHQQYNISNSKAKQMYVNKRNSSYYTPKSASYSIFSNDMQNRLPPIKEFRSPSKASIASPSRTASAPRLR